MEGADPFFLINKGFFKYLYKMININKNSSNTIILTLTERFTASGGTYTAIRFKNDNTLEEIFLTLDDESLYGSRYNYFTIYETGSTFVNLCNPNDVRAINLKPGMYTYTAYQKLAKNCIQTGMTQVEVGKAIVEGDDINTPIVYQ